mmetsp:Transcript_9083/g.25366  ORF Transcript_9083/g.25366 Transcript_9083/m.25366 type:complete len:98 (-) Transcript_9083:559-852(-)
MSSSASPQRQKETHDLGVTASTHIGLPLCTSSGAVLRSGEIASITGTSALGSLRLRSGDLLGDLDCFLGDVRRGDTPGENAAGETRVGEGRVADASS